MLQGGQGFPGGYDEVEAQAGWKGRVCHDGGKGSGAGLEPSMVSCVRATQPALISMVYFYLVDAIGDRPKDGRVARRGGRTQKGQRPRQRQRQRQHQRHRYPRRCDDCRGGFKPEPDSHSPPKRAHQGVTPLRHTWQMNGVRGVRLPASGGAGRAVAGEMDYTSISGPTFLPARRPVSQGATGVRERGRRRDTRRKRGPPRQHTRRGELPSPGVGKARRRPGRP